MKVVTWNCMGAFRKKASYLLPFEPDWVLVQECERPEKLNFENGFQPVESHWFGEPKAKKGVGIFSLSDYRFELAADVYDPSIRYCIPLRASGPRRFNLIAVWAMRRNRDARLSYIGQVWLALGQYRSFIRERETLLVGDFNSNKIFDYAHADCSHSVVVEQLARENIVSLYHEYYSEPHGTETRPTFFMQKKPDRPFHLDYCFAPKTWRKQVEAVQVGEYPEWRPWSDHTPLAVDFT